MRLFIAINFSNIIKHRLLAICDELYSASSFGRFSLAENLHLTLAFLGECDNKQMMDAKSAMDAIDFKSFDIMIDSIGRFKRGGGDIWWAGVAENKLLLELQRNLCSNLREHGFELEKRRYSPHITLGREIITSAKPQKIEPFGETIIKFELMKSERVGGKLMYTAIHVSEK